MCSLPSLSKTSFFDRLQRSKESQRQATRTRSVCGYSRGSSCAVRQNTLCCKLFLCLLSVSMLCKLPPYKEARKSSNTCVLTICGFFDTLSRLHGCAACQIMFSRLPLPFPTVPGLPSYWIRTMQSPMRRPC